MFKKEGVNKIMEGKLARASGGTDVGETLDVLRAAAKEPGLWELTVAVLGGNPTPPSEPKRVIPYVRLPRTGQKDVEIGGTK